LSTEDLSERIKAEVAFRGDGFSSRVLKVPAPSLTPESPDLEEPDAKEVPKRKGLILTPNPAAAAADPSTAVRTSGPGKSSGSAAAAAADEEELPDWADDNDGDAGDFQGACGAAQEQPPLLQCADCSRTFFWATWLAHLHPDNQFAKVVDPRIKTTIDKARNKDFENRVLDKPVRPVCAYCCGKYMKRNDFVHVVDGKDKPTNTFVNLAKKSKGVSRGKKSVARTVVFNNEAQFRRQEIEAGPPADAEQTFKQLTQSGIFRRATDWYVEIASFTLLFYGCGCGLYPVKPGHWWRLIRLCKEFKEGLSDAGQDVGHWHCGACLAQWNWTSMGAKRMFVIGNLSDTRTLPVFCYIGDTQGTDLEQKIIFLKGVQMLRQLNGKPVTKENILELLEASTERVTAKLMRCIPQYMRMVESKDASSVHNRKIYCEDHRLQLNTAGIRYACIDVNLMPEEVKPYTMTNDELDEILDFVASCLDIEGVNPTQPAMKKAQKSILYRDTQSWAPNPRFSEGRERLARIIGQIRP
jgi:hypothetical protein